MEPQKVAMDPLVKQWLEQRHKFVVLYDQLCATKPLGSSRGEKLTVFCQTLIDYVSLGHFTIFEKIAEHYQKHQAKATGLDQQVLTQISKTTDIILDFNEKYTLIDNLQSLSEDLSHLGEHIAHRMDWEDGLVKPYLQYCH